MIQFRSAGKSALWRSSTSAKQRHAIFLRPPINQNESFCKGIVLDCREIRFASDHGVYMSDRFPKAIGFSIRKKERKKK